MNIIEALKTGKALRRPIPKHVGSSGNGYLGNRFVIDELTDHHSNHYYFNELKTNWINEEDLLANDWEILKEKNDS